jgi:hypothetical protein
MKKVLRMIGGFVAVMGLVCALSGSAQARTFVSVNVRSPWFYGRTYYSTAYCSPYAYARPAYRHYCAPAYYYRGGYCYR